MEEKSNSKLQAELQLLRECFDAEVALRKQAEADLQKAIEVTVAVSNEAEYALREAGLL